MLEAARDADGHLRLAFDQPGTWSLKYNLVWDKLLGLGLFSDAVRAAEVERYKAAKLPYGLPLDCRSALAKLDWAVWAAALASEPEDWDVLMQPVYRWVHETEDRVPLSDRYMADGPHHRGYRNRSVVGAIFIKVLQDAFEQQN